LVCRQSTTNANNPLIENFQGTTFYQKKINWRLMIKCARK
jgi:hypothetical protein